MPATPGATLDVPATRRLHSAPDQGRHAERDRRCLDRRSSRATRARPRPTASRWHCAAPTDGSNSSARSSVKKDGSKTTTKASYNAKKDVATGTAKVAGSKFKLAGTGKVKFTLKKGSKTVKSITAS